MDTKACCDLGKILHDQRERVLFETPNFFVTPTIGPIGIEGYLLILTKECYKGTGDIPEKMHQELDELTTMTRKILKDNYGTDSLVFEHGPRVCGVRGGGCLDHAHLHVVPGADIIDDLAADLFNRLDSIGTFFKAERAEGFKRAMEIYQARKCSYFIAESLDSRRMFVEVNFHIPSQYIRRLIADDRKTGEWNWKLYPQHETVNRTIDRLKNKF